MDSPSCDGMVVSPAPWLDEAAQCQSCSGVCRVLVWHVPTAWPEGTKDLGRDRRVTSSELPSAGAPVWKPGGHKMFSFRGRAIAGWRTSRPPSGKLTGVLKASRELMCFKGIANQLGCPVRLRLLPFEVGYFCVVLIDSD